MTALSVETLITRSSKSNFLMSFSLLPPPKRDAIHTVYAFCRCTDDIVDEGDDHEEDDVLRRPAPREPAPRRLRRAPVEPRPDREHGDEQPDVGHPALTRGVVRRGHDDARRAGGRLVRARGAGGVAAAGRGPVDQAPSCSSSSASSSSSSVSFSHTKRPASMSRSGGTEPARRPAIGETTMPAR